MAFTEKDIEHLATLSALEFSKQETEDFVKEFDNIAAFVSQIQQANIPAQAVYDKIIPLQELREDKSRQGLANDEVLMNAPKKAKGAFAVPLMME